MAEPSPIFSAKIDNQKIGYIGGTEAFDLLGNKRCNYNPSTGNLLELDSGRTKIEKQWSRRQPTAQPKQYKTVEIIGIEIKQSP
jgi:hypothetical protein